MAILQKLNSKANLRKTSGGDLPYQTSYPVIARYEADSTASQTLINMTFSVDQANKESFQLFIDGKLLREGSSNDFTFTSIQADNTSSQITLNAPIDANLNIVAIKLGLKVDSLSSGSSAVSSGGSKNYFSLNNANPDFEKNVTSPWLPCTLAWSGTAPSGAPTLAASNMTLSVSNSNPLSGSYSMLLTKASGSSAQYQGFISAPLTIDREDVAKVLYGSYSYELVSGTADFSGTSTQTYEIWVWNYDPANPSAGQWIQPAGYRGMNQSSGVGKVVFSFQTDGTFTNNAYKIAVITQQTGTGAIVVKFDDFQIGPAAIVTGAVVTDWQSYTPTFTGLGSPTSVGFSYRRVGDSIEIQGKFTVGTSTATEARISLPSGLTISDTAKIPSLSKVGSFAVSYIEAFQGDVLAEPSVTYLTLGKQGSATPGLQKLNGNSVLATSGQICSLFAKIPVTGFSSSVQVSSDTDTRIVDFRATTLSSTTFTAGTALSFTTVSKDSHGAWNGTNSYRIPVSGDYLCSMFFYRTSANTTVQIYKNGVIYDVSSYLYVPNTVPVSGAYLLPNLNAGDLITFVPGVSTTIVSAPDAQVSLFRLSGPSVIAANETVACRYTNTSGQAISQNSNTTVTNWTKDYDTHSFFSGSSGIATIPVSGKFSCNYSLLFSSGAFGSSSQLSIMLDQAGSVTRTIYLASVFPSAAGTNYVQISGSETFNALAGDTITVRVFQNTGTGTRSLDVSGSYTHIAFTRVGN